ncbi:MAG: acyltransferase [Prevotella sp.]|uniref:acyltransferase family protein n=1 Tax=Prevotella sp. TaxID=59823 RepID=UPI002A9D8D6E|nr:acyltransferase [Prevotella sp.]MDD7188907.1 acyltransferase [Prevotella sp.]MDY5314359.1 acyltransferase [Prevotella sp.]
MRISLYNDREATENGGESLLTRAECNALRGIAILGIFLHNFCHWLNPVVKENEYQYFQHNVDWFAQCAARVNELFPAHVISFFGHYGVPVFLFLSAYGLEMKYGNGQGKAPDGRRVVVSSFVRYHYLKLFKMMIVGFICFTVVDAMTAGSWHYNVAQIVGQLLMINNFYDQPDRNIWPGPFWFFGLMLQLYVVYRLLLYRRHWGWTVGLMAVCTVAQLFMDPEGENLNYWRYNFMGGMLPFGLGLLFARYGNKVMLVNLTFGSFLMSWVVCSFFIVSASGSFYTWVIVPALVCYASVYFIKTVSTLPLPWLRARIGYVLGWLGNVSAALFVIHPAIRKVFITVSRQGDIYTGLLLYAIASLGAAWLVMKLMRHIPNPKL